MVTEDGRCQGRKDNPARENRYTTVSSLASLTHKPSRHTLPHPPNQLNIQELVPAKSLQDRSFHNQEPFIQPLDSFMPGYVRSCSKTRYSAQRKSQGKSCFSTRKKKNVKCAMSSTPSPSIPTPRPCLAVLTLSLTFDPISSHLASLRLSLSPCPLASLLTPPHLTPYIPDLLAPATASLSAASFPGFIACPLTHSNAVAAPCASLSFTRSRIPLTRS